MEKRKKYKHVTLEIRSQILQSAKRKWLSVGSRKWQKEQKFDFQPNRNT
jgi:hypothetical protein